jgi:hypothetical protein
MSAESSQGSWLHSALSIQNLAFSNQNLAKSWSGGLLRSQLW